MKLTRVMGVTCAFFALFSSSAAAEPYVSVPGVDAAGPEQYERTWVEIFGPRSAKRVLVLVPGTQGGSGSFRLVARNIVRRTRNLQVWAWNRRANAFEDTSVFEMRDPDAAYAYYLNGGEVGGRRFAPVPARDAPFVREWGLEVAVEDLRRVVKLARAGGRRKVILGGHSIGASTVQAYAAWDFDGRPGYRNIKALVLIDGGLMTGNVPSPDEVKASLAELEAGDPFFDLLGLGVPWAAGVFSQVGGLYARKRPNRRSVLQQYPLLPPSLNPPFPVTSEAHLGFAFDSDTSPRALGLVHVHAGGLRQRGQLRLWRDGGVTPIQRFARGLAYGGASNFSEWYFPTRLMLDLQAASELDTNESARMLGLRTFHRAQIDVPVYAFQSELTGGGIFPRTKRFIRGTRIPGAGLVSDEKHAHLDPLVARPRENTFLQTVVPFLTGPLD